MKKIPSLFVRNPENPKYVTREVNPDCAWVIAGEGTATRKWDGAACMIRLGTLYKRYDCKKGKTPPANFEPCSEPDPVTGHWPGWVPVGQEPESRWFREAFEMAPGLPDGTYECVGPKVGGNPDGFQAHTLVPHGMHRFNAAPRTFDGLEEWLQSAGIEGLVWHHPDGRMAKIKARDFGIAWPPKKAEVKP